MKKATFFILSLLVTLSIAAGEIEINKRYPLITATYDEVVDLVNYSLVQNDHTHFYLDVSRQDIISPGSPPITEFTFTTPTPLPNGYYSFTIIAEDEVDNIVTKTETFQIDVPFTTFTLIEPTYGVSPYSVFDLIVETTDTMEGCRYSRSQPKDYSDIKQQSLQFQTSQSQMTHTKIDFTIAEEDISIDIYVVCNSTEGITNNNEPQHYSILWDASPPKINAYSEPAKVIEELKVKLIAESLIHSNNRRGLELDKKDLVSCRFDTDSSLSYAQMRYPFYHDTNEYNTRNEVLLTDKTTPGINDSTTHTFYVICKNRAGNLSQKKTIKFDVDLDAGSMITSFGPSGYIKTDSILMWVDTNRNAECTYSEDGGPKTIFHGNMTKSHTIQLEDLEEKDYVFEIYCSKFAPTGDPREAKIEFTVDKTKPSKPKIKIYTACTTDMLEANFSADDNEGIDFFQYKITDGTNDITWYKNVTAKKDASYEKRKGLDLEVGEQYYFEVMAIDKAGNVGDPASSGPITIHNESDDECLEKNPPEVIIDVSQNPNDITIKIICIDSESGCDEINYRYINEYETLQGCSDNYPSIYLNPFTEHYSGKVCYRAVDKAGNEVKGDEDVKFEAQPCDFSHPNVSLDGEEICDDSIDNDCDGDIDCDDNECIYDDECDELDSELDSDDDGMPDYWEDKYGLSPHDPRDAYFDPDEDGLTNLEEYLLGTDPTVSDTDGDGWLDGAERTCQSNPLDTSNYPIDEDSDRICDNWELDKCKDLTSCYDEGDADSDGLSDYKEQLYNTDPFNIDTDDDKLNDFEEVDKYKTNPKKQDTDGDGYTDYEEIEEDTDPLNSDDYPKKIIDVDSDISISDADVPSNIRIFPLILILLGILFIMGGGGWLMYKRFSGKKEKKPYSIDASQTISTKKPQNVNTLSNTEEIPEDLKASSQSIKENLGLQRRLISERKSKIRERSRIFDAFDDKNQEDGEEKDKELKSTKKKVEGIDLKEVKEDKKAGANEAKLEQAKRIMQDIAAKETSENAHDLKNTEKFTEKLDSIVQSEKNLKKIEKLFKGEIPSHIQEKLNKLAKQKQNLTELPDFSFKKESIDKELTSLIHKYQNKKNKTKDNK